MTTHSQNHNLFTELSSFLCGISDKLIFPQIVFISKILFFIFLDTQENYSSVVSPPGAIPSVVHDQHRWTVFDSKVNLPAALNDPLRVKRETDFFTKTWGQEFYENLYVPESRYLPDIDRKYFEKYKHRISKVHLFSKI